MFNFELLWQKSFDYMVKYLIIDFLSILGLRSYFIICGVPRWDLRVATRANRTWVQNLRWSKKVTISFLNSKSMIKLLPKWSQKVLEQCSIQFQKTSLLQLPKSPEVKIGYYMKNSSKLPRFTSIWTKKITDFSVC